MNHTENVAGSHLSDYHWFYYSDTPGHIYESFDAPKLYMVGDVTAHEASDSGIYANALFPLTLPHLIVGSHLPKS